MVNGQFHCSYKAIIWLYSTYAFLSSADLYLIIKQSILPHHANSDPPRDISDSHRMNPFQDNSVIAMAANSSPYFSNTAENPSVIMFQLQRRRYCFFA